MPKMNGFELFQRIKDKEHEYGGTSIGIDKPRVCFITAYDEYRSKFKEIFPTAEEVKCFLKKPIPMPDLLKRIKLQLGLL
jgi:CheY-like chemotaxis protein